MEAGVTRHIAVVGGGVVGLATAYYLRRDGAEVTVLERATIGSGASWGNTGWIAPTFSAPLPGPGMTGVALRALVRPNGSFYLSARHLPRLAPWLWGFWRASSASRHEAGMRAIAGLALRADSLYDELAADGVQLEMRPYGVVHAFAHRARAEAGLRKLLPLAELGFQLPNRVIDGRQLREIEPALGDIVTAGFVIPSERAVYPPSLLGGLRARLVEMDVCIREHRPVSGFRTDSSAIRAVRCGDETLEIDEVVLAAGVWTRPLAAKLGVRVPLEAGKGYSFTISPEPMPAHCLHLDEVKVAATPFTAGLRVGGTMELSGTDTHLNRRRLAAVARAAAPYLRSWRPESIREEWMGMRPVTPDGLPIIGRPRRWRNLAIAAGHAMQGVMLAPPTGHLLARVVLGEADAEELRPFSPDRFMRSEET
jgi:D-amino-acid dehydrogenase